jgi:hypothetical protein
MIGTLPHSGPSRIDQRRRIDGSPPGPVADVMDGLLPRALAGVAGADLQAAGLTPGPLTIETPVGTWVLRAEPEPVVRRGEATEGARVRMDEAQLGALLDDQVTFMGLYSAGRLDQRAGRLEQLQDWGVVLRSALDGRRVHVPGAVSFVDRHGDPLDLGATFDLDDLEDAPHFLAEAGYLRIRQLFSAGEMAAVSDDMDRIAPGHEDGDGRSWWATTEGGERRVVRMQGFDAVSAATATLLADQRFLGLADLAGAGHVPPAGHNRIEALFKPIGVVQGISDVPWHKDCGIGRHSYDCCSMTVGISVTGAGAGTGQLRVHAGSHRALVWPALAQPGLDLPVVDLATGVGDVTIHLSCTSHMAQPPVVAERRVLYTSFTLPPRSAAAAAGLHQLSDLREAAPVSVSQPPAPRGVR